MIKIIIIDSNEAEQHRIKTRLCSQNDFEIIGSGQGRYDAIRLVEKKQPDIVIMDICLKDGEGLDLIPLLKSKSPGTSIVLLTDIEDEEHIYQALIHEPAGYIIKQGDISHLCAAIKDIYQGGCFFSSSVASKICSIFSKMAKVVTKECVHTNTALFKKEINSQPIVPTGISGMELQIIAFIAQGCSTHEIAGKLSITDATTRNYISVVMRKAGVNNRNQLTLFALRRGLIQV
jgi:DNA-binding NarL/FixJ family response regulator